MFTDNAALRDILTELAQLRADQNHTSNTIICLILAITFGVVLYLLLGDSIRR